MLPLLLSSFAVKAVPISLRRVFTFEPWQLLFVFVFHTNPKQRVLILNWVDREVHSWVHVVLFEK